ncbi:Cai-1 autoinducer sensor kinase/phosphatase cqss [Plakobranchus ocellatus]|uniref:Cai-1 autoinducer sensor kinase/phosphatase cqss n=1 Tax=Plakobranchus ocellatus TaxID=259542 RepID=A0AAV3XWE0_9GAST|nr:Cai-1 autoinducer sensor kinase/phosphatase cqss [Plakobranchus ocellatus]
MSRKKKYLEAREYYQKDSDLADTTPYDDNQIYSADLQRVVMLPMMEQFKRSIFSRQLCCFNETFSKPWPSGASQYRPSKIDNRPHLSTRVAIDLKHGSKSFFYKTSHNQDEATELKFLKASFDPKQPRGVEPNKKKCLISYLYC